MKKFLEGDIVRLYPSDWRYSAAIVGLVRYFNNRGFDFIQTEDYIEYDYTLVQDETSYLLFAEEFFKERMHHLTLLGLLELEELTAEQEKLFNDKLVANTVCKKVFGKLKYDVGRKETFINLIEKNRLELIKETFKNPIYINFFPVSKKGECKMFSEKGEVCRIEGYYVDTKKKINAISFSWNKKTLVYSDWREFDFIPFAFTKTRQSFFVNNNYTIDLLVNTNDNLFSSLVEKNEDEKYLRKNLFFQSQQSSTYIDYDVEIVTKNQDDDFFETMFVRKQTTKILKSIEEKEYNSLATSLKMNDKLYLNIEENVVSSILNQKHLDSLIENSIKKAPTSSYRTQVLIKINSKIYGGANMEEKILKARNTAFAVKENIDDNKIKSYRQKLISAISFKDYDRFCQILLQLSDYSGVIFNFAYDLFDDFEANKNIAYSFVNGLNDSYNGGEK